MFGFLMGIVLGAIGGAAYGSRYFRDTDLQAQFNDTQDRLTNLMSEVRSVLDETRGELRQAWEKTRDSAVEKAERLQTVALTGEPEAAKPDESGSSNGTTTNGKGSAASASASTPSSASSTSSGAVKTASGAPSSTSKEPSH